MERSTANLNQPLSERAESLIIVTLGAAFLCAVVRLNYEWTVSAASRVFHASNPFQYLDGISQVEVARWESVINGTGTATING